MRGKTATGMARRFIGLVVLLFLLGTSVVSYSLANLSQRTTALMVTTDTSRLHVECNQDSAETNASGGVVICHSVQSKVTLDLRERDWSVRGQVSPQPSRTGLAGTYLLNDLVQVSNLTDTTFQLDIDVREGWPGSIGVCTSLARDSGQVWFIMADSGDTGQVYTLEPHSTIQLSFELEAPPGGGLSALSADSQPTMIIKANTPP